MHEHGGGLDGDRGHQEVVVDVQLGLFTTVEWVMLTTQVREVSQACETLLRRWGEVLDGARGGPIASVFPCFLCLFWNIFHHPMAFPFKRHET